MDRTQASVPDLQLISTDTPPPPPCLFNKYCLNINTNPEDKKVDSGFFLLLINVMI